MAISSSDRKLLWARAHNRCALCRKPLTRPADGDELAGLILGEEAHIVARNPAGPRGADRAGVAIDGYGNLILLCSEDHKRVDDQPRTFSINRLNILKADHERWAEEQHDRPEFRPIRITASAEEGAIPFGPLNTGRQVWDLVAGAQGWGLDPLDDSHTEEEIDAADQFLQTAQDWGGIAEEVELSGLRAIRAAQRLLSETLNDLWSAGVYAWGRRVTRTITGGIGEPVDWILAQLVTRTLADLEAEDLTEASSST